MLSFVMIAIGFISVFEIKFIEDENKLKLKDLLIFGIIAAIGVYGYSLFEGYVESQGYKFPEF